MADTKDDAPRRFRDKRQPRLVDQGNDSALAGAAGAFSSDDDPQGGDENDVPGAGMDDNDDQEDDEDDENIVPDNENGDTPVAKGAGMEDEDIAVVNGEEFVQAMGSSIESGLEKGIANLLADPKFEKVLGRLVNVAVAKANEPVLALVKANSETIDGLIEHADDRFDDIDRKQLAIEKSLTDLSSANLVKADTPGAVAAVPPNPANLTAAPPLHRTVVPPGQTTVEKGVVPGTAAPGGGQEATPLAELNTLISKAESLQEQTGQAVPGLTDVVITKGLGRMPDADSIEALRQGIAGMTVAA